MPRHIFNCAQCNHGNTVDIAGLCGCHECEGRRPVVTFYKTVGVLIRSAAIILSFGVLSLGGGCYLDHWSKIRTADIAQRQDAEAKKAAAEQDAANKRFQIDQEIRRLEAVRALNLDSYDVKVTQFPDGRIGVNLVPKAVEK